MLAPMSGAKKAEGDAMVAAAKMALGDAGDRLADGQEIVMAIRDENGPSWGAVSEAVMGLVLDDEAVAVIASTSGADAHVCEQVGNRMGVPVLTLAADATTTQINIPWIFRMRASDEVEAEMIGREIYREGGFRRVLLVSEADHDGERGVAAMARAASALGVAAPDDVAIDPLRVDVRAVMERILGKNPDVVVIWTAPSTAGALMRALSAAGVRADVYLSRDAAAGNPGEIARTVVAEVGIGQAFAERYRKTTGVEANAEAREVYDAVTITVRALRAVGANRVRVRDALAKENFVGASGMVSFDREGNDRVGVKIMQVRSHQTRNDRQSGP
jgi:ABC-type branched-subunit amino acid transport system substrate-binding protein